MTRWTSQIFTMDIWTHKWPSFTVCGFIADLVRTSQSPEYFMLLFLVISSYMSHFMYHFAQMCTNLVNRVVCKPLCCVSISSTHWELHIFHLCSSNSPCCALVVLFLHLTRCCARKGRFEYHNHLNFYFAQRQCQPGHAKGQLHESRGLFPSFLVRFHFCCLNRVYRSAQHQSRVACVV